MKEVICMERLILKKLVAWKESKHRKPLILKGVRQVGKTWLLREFGRQHYKNIAYFNFDEHEEYKQFFETTKDVNRILQNLMMISGVPIKPEETLIIFDEIQECNKALNTLKYFCENAPEYHVACAGSLLGITLSKPASFPVGKVDFLQVAPMTFTEFLLANGDKNLAAYMNSTDSLEPIPEAFFNPLSEKLKMYFVTGGMPESVHAWTEARDTELMQQVLSNILDAYERDFAKHAEPKEFPKLSMIWRSIPSQLARENKKFIYKVVREGARAREYEDALQWLCDANLVYKIYRSTAPGLPISAYDDLSSFKLYLVDVGLLRRLSLLAPSAFGEANRLFTEFKGALSENYILQALSNQFEATPRYWTMNNPRYEVDYLIQRENDLIPVEVKVEDNIGSRSLKKFKEKYGDKVKLRVRFSMQNLKLDDGLLNIPLFMADQADRLMGIALKTL
jgi:predicted AAA+ superfamily ATPase